jgi:hypothetical protein
MTDHKSVDLNAPVTAEEIQARLKDLTPEQLAQARQQQIDNAILNPKSEDKIDWSRLSDSDFVKTRQRLFGF